MFEFGSVTHWCSLGRLWFLVPTNGIAWLCSERTWGSSCYLLQPWKINSAHAVCSGELRSLLLLIHGIFSRFSL